LRNGNNTGEGFRPLDGGIRKELLHIGPEHPQIEVIINPATIYGILKNSIDLLPLWGSSFALCMHGCKSKLSSLEITERELVVFTPALWNVLSPLLD